MKYPRGLPKRYRYHWSHAWTWRARRHRGFKKWLRRHGYLSPHFTTWSARSKDGAPVPVRLRKAAQVHAFKLERLRHALGDKPINPLSWYRSPSHNRRVGGARNSMHMRAIATDHSRQWVQSVGRARVLWHAYRIWPNGGIGTYIGGNLHFDSRGWRARWNSWVPGR